MNINAIVVAMMFVCIFRVCAFLGTQNVNVEVVLLLTLNIYIHIYIYIYEMVKEHEYVCATS